MNIHLGFKNADDLNSQGLAQLIYASGPELFDLLFGTQDASLAFLKKSCCQANGQFSHHHHYLAYTQNEIVACMALWDHQPTDEFVEGTLKSLAKYLDPKQLSFLSQLNQTLSKVLPAPLPHELCLGHLSVNPSFKRQGMASKLIDKAKLEAKSRAKQCLILDVNTDNSPAINCYQRLGFLKASRRDFPQTPLSFTRMQIDI